MKRFQEDTPLVVVVALLFFGGLAGVAFAGGLFDRLGGELTLLLGAFAAAFAVLTYHLDPGGAQLREAPRRAARSGEQGRRPHRRDLRREHER
jgi:hypothetical protein